MKTNGRQWSRTDADFVEGYRSVSDDLAAHVGVLTCMRGSRPHAIAVDSYMDVSYGPPTMAVSVYSGSRMQESLDMADGFVLNLLAEDQKSVAQWLGEPGQPLYGLLDSVPTFTTASGRVAIAGSIAWFDCDSVTEHEIATHTLSVGAVRVFGRPGRPSFATGTSVSGRPGPLLRWAGEYGAFTTRPS